MKCPALQSMNTLSSRKYAECQEDDEMQSMYV